jgi:hypothetical protein
MFNRASIFTFTNFTFDFYFFLSTILGYRAHGAKYFFPCIQMSRDSCERNKDTHVKQAMLSAETVGRSADGMPHTTSDICDVQLFIAHHVAHAIRNSLLAAAACVTSRAPFPTPQILHAAALVHITQTQPGGIGRIVSKLYDAHGADLPRPGEDGVTFS